MQKLNAGRIIRQIPPAQDNPRNSEGDFLRLRDGRILFAYSRYHGNSWDDGAACDIAGLYSSDNGESFSEAPIFLAKASEYGVDNIMSVTLSRMANGDLGLYYIVKNADLSDYGVLRRSKDEGESFYQTTHVLPACPGYYVLNNCRVEKTASGRLIAPVSWHRTGKLADGKDFFDGVGTAFFYYSDDDGFTWQEAPDRVVLPSTHTQTGLQEPGVVTLPNGSLYAYFRTDLFAQYESYSVDDGLHWSAAQPSAFSSPASPLKIARSPYSGIYYAVWNPIPEYFGRNSTSSWGRTPLVIAQSEDGLHFSEPMILEDAPDHGYCYPAIFFPDEKSILLSYCSGGPDSSGVLCRTTIRKIDL